jgi:putative hydrolase of the HAD superfamily
MQTDDQPSVDALDAIAAVRRPHDTLCLASNQERVRARYITEQMGFSARFDKLYFSCDLGVAKPHSEYYLAIQRDLGASPRQMHFWDDSPGHVHAAAALGWNAHVYDGSHAMNEPPRG